MIVGDPAVYDATLNNGMIFLGFLVLLGLNVLFAVIAAILIFAVVTQLAMRIQLVKYHEIINLFFNT